MLAVRDAEAIVHRKVGEVDATTQIVRLETWVDVFLGPYAADSFVLDCIIFSPDSLPGILWS